MKSNDFKKGGVFTSVTYAGPGNIHTHTYTHIHTYIHTCTHMHTHTRTQTHIHTYIHTHTASCGTFSLS
jgi:hypothetical protein